eukprot:3156032-Pyramimonas_sp.AAC.1
MSVLLYADVLGAPETAVNQGQRIGRFQKRLWPRQPLSWEPQECRAKRGGRGVQGQCRPWRRSEGCCI